MGGPRRFFNAKDNMSKNQMNDLLIEAMMHLEIASAEGLDSGEVNDLIWKAHEKVQSCWRLLTSSKDVQ